MKTDEALMTSYQEGSEEAFNELFKKYSPLVFGYARKRLSNSEVEDFYQKVWRHLHEKRHLYQGHPFAPWFYTLIRHLLIDEYRKQGRLNSFEERIFQNDDTEILEELLKELPEENARLIKKYYLEGESYEELSRTLGVSESTLRQRLSRSMRTLKSLVGRT